MKYEKLANETLYINLFMTLHKRNIPQKVLAKAIDIQPSIVSEWRHGKRKISLQQARQIGYYLDVTPEFILGLSDEDVSPKLTVRQLLKELAKILENVHESSECVCNETTDKYKAMYLTLADEIARLISDTECQIRVAKYVPPIVEKPIEIDVPKATEDLTETAPIPINEMPEIITPTAIASEAEMPQPDIATVERKPLSLLERLAEKTRIAKAK